MIFSEEKIRHFFHPRRQMSHQIITMKNIWSKFENMPLTTARMRKDYHRPFCWKTKRRFATSKQSTYCKLNLQVLKRQSSLEQSRIWIPNWTLNDFTVLKETNQYTQKVDWQDEKVVFLMSHSRPPFYSFSSFQHSWQYINVLSNKLPITGSNHGPLESEATTLPTEPPQPLPIKKRSFWFNSLWFSLEQLNFNST